MKHLVLAVLLALPASALAQTTIKVGGVEVNTNGAKTTVKTPTTQVETDKGDATVKTKSAKVKVADASDKSTAPNQHKAIKCDKDEEIVVEAVTFVGKTAIRAGGNCSVTVRAGVFNTTKVAIVASGNAVVTLEACTVNGPTAIETSGNASIKSTGSTFNGKLKLSGNSTVETQSSVYNGAVTKKGNATLEDGGDNVFNAQ